MKGNDFVAPLMVGRRLRQHYSRSVFFVAFPWCFASRGFQFSSERRPDGAPTKTNHGLIVSLVLHLPTREATATSNGCTQLPSFSTPLCSC